MSWPPHPPDVVADCWEQSAPAHLLPHALKVEGLSI